MIQSQFFTRILRKSSPTLIAAVIAIGLLASASRGLAITMTWTNGSAQWTSTTAWTTNLASGQDATDPGLSNVTCIAGPVSNVTATCAGGTGGFPGMDDQARFTNNTSYTVTVNITTNVSVITFTNSTGTVTLDGSGSTLSVTGRFRVADAYATSTVVWAGGTLSVIGIGGGGAPTLQVGSAGSNNVGTFIVANGTVVGGGSISVGAAATSVGNLVVSGPGVFTNATGQVPNNNFNFRLRSAGSQLIITNGGKFFWPDQVRSQSNSLILVSGTNSSLNSFGIATSTLIIGDLEGPGCRLIVSNGAKAVSENGTVSIGRGNGSSNTGIVVGAGSQLIAKIGAGTGAGITIGNGSAVHNGNDLIVYDGGYVYTDGAFFNIGGTGTNCSFHMGGAGAMSTGFAVSVRANSGQQSPLMVVTNAVFTCSVLGQQGVSNNVLTVLSKGTLIFSNQYAVSATTTNVLNANGLVTINAGTINAVSGTNALGVRIGVNAGVPGSTLNIINGGKLLSELGTIGSGSSFNTGIVTGVGSVWSNWTSGIGYVNSNRLAVGSDIAGGFNYLAVLNGASLINNGLLKVRSTNSLVFTAGTISTGATDIDPGANNSNEFVVGDGTSAAYYDMAGGTNYHTFGSPGLVVTNNASLRGSGTITGTTTVLGTFVPGFANSVGSIFSSNSLSFGNLAVLNYDLGTISDTATINSNMKLGGTLNITDAGGFTTGNYTLFTYTGTLSASGTLTVGATPNGSWTYVVDTNTVGSVILQVTGGSDPYTTWTTHYGLSGGNAAGTADPDGDGMSNTNEFLAGFNPTSSAAYLHIISVTRTATTNITVTYLGASGDSAGSAGPKTNVLDFTTGGTGGNYSNNFQSANQTNILTGGTGLGGLSSFVDTNGAIGATRYYRVRVLVP